MRDEYISGGLLIFITIFSTVNCAKRTSCNENALLSNLSQSRFELSCREHNLTRFPVFRRIKPQVETFDLQYNRISIILSDSLNGYSSLIELNLAGNGITRIQERAFTGAKRLEKLDLSNNIISTFSSPDLAESLTWLSIARNPLRSIPTSLKHFKRLKHLDLSNNHFITRMDEGSLPSSLVELNLRYTGIKFFSQTTFAGLGGLKTLHLSDNIASSSLKFSNRPFDELKSLEYIDLSRSFCRRLRADSFSALKNLKVLLMNNCWLTTPPVLTKRLLDDQVTAPTTTALNTTGAWSSETWYNPNLEILDLSNNRRLTINSGFRTPPSLKEVHLKRCRVPSLDVPIFTENSAALVVDLTDSGVTSLCEDAFSKAKNLSKVVLTGNPIRTIPQFPESLRFLNISKTSITNITRSSLARLSRLTETKLNQAQIQNLEDNVFRNMTLLQKIDLSSNFLQKLTRYTFRIGTRQKRALLTHKGQSRLIELNVSSNALRRIHRKAFLSHTHLRILDLSRNEIGSLAKKQFDGLHSLEELYLQSNRISDVAGRALAGLANLRILHMENNMLEILYHGTFSNLPNLTHLFLQNNGIAIISQLRMPALQYIDLSNNTLFELPKMPSQIRTVKAYSNEIDRISSVVFASAEHLEVLELNSCYLKSINFGMFSNTPLLKTLNLSDNLLTHFVDYRISSLENLYMGFNQIGNVTCALGDILPNLETLDLRENSISVINPKIFDDSKKLKRLLLSGNILNCDCNLRDFVNWIYDVEDAGVVTDAHLYQCESPTDEDIYAMPVLETVKSLTDCGGTDFADTDTDSDTTVALTNGTLKTVSALPEIINQNNNTIILASCGAVFLLLGICVAYAITKKWTVKVKLKVTQNNNKHLRGKAVKSEADIETTDLQCSKVT